MNKQGLNLENKLNIKNIQNQVNSQINLNKPVVPNQTMQINDLILTKKIGEGGFGEVYIGYFVSNPGFSIACKKMSKQKIFNNQLIRHLKNELRIYETVNHPNIVKYIGLRETMNSFYLIFEHLECGTLTNLIKDYSYKNKSIGLPENLIQQIMRKLVDAVKFLHKNNIIHRDLKPDNILFTKDSNSISSSNSDYYSKLIPKIIDFGFSRFLHEDEIATTTLGTPSNMAPNILTKLVNKVSRLESFKVFGYKLEADIWSLGCILFQMLTEKSPFESNNYEYLYEKIRKGNYSIPSKKYLSNNKISLEILSLLNGMLLSNTKRRLSIEAIENHPFLVKDVSELNYHNYTDVVKVLNYLEKTEMLNSNKLKNVNSFHDRRDLTLNIFKEYFIDCTVEKYLAIKKQENSNCANRFLVFNKFSENTIKQQTINIDKNSLVENKESKNLECNESQSNKYIPLFCEKRPLFSVSKGLDEKQFDEKLNLKSDEPQFNENSFIKTPYLNKDLLDMINSNYDSFNKEGHEDDALDNLCLQFDNLIYSDDKNNQLNDAVINEDDENNNYYYSNNNLVSDSELEGIMMGQLKFSS